MSTYLDEKRRRIEQFAQYLRLMGLRRHKIAKRDCFIIFDESAPEDAQSPQCKESAAIKADCLANGSSASGKTGLADLPPADWSPAAFRYVQLAFKRDGFYLDLRPFGPAGDLHCRAG